MTQPRSARPLAAEDEPVSGRPSTLAGPAANRSILEKCRTYTAPDELRAAGLFTFFRTIESGQDPVVTMGGREMVMLGSNNYLGLTSHPKIKERAIAAVRKYGAGCAGSRLLNGTLDIHVELEERLAAFMKKPACVTFSTGFLVNLGVISSLAGKGDTIYLDRQDHACIFDGARLAVGADVKKFKHNDPADLRRLLALNGDRSGRMLVVDGVFSMEGDIAPLPQYTEICDDYDMALMVDDAHGVGVLGKHGRGTAEHFGLEDKVDLIMGTFSKSLATVGGFVVGEPDVIKFVKHRARALMFTAAPPPASVAAVLAALDIIESEPERRDRLWENTRFMLTALRAIGFDCGDSSTPVIPIVVGPDQVAFTMAKKLEDEGVFVNAVVSPASPPGRALIRTSYMATHTKEHLARAVEAFHKVGRELGLVS
jgi:8-amino-7-oxononanoate synthase